MTTKTGQSLFLVKYHVGDTYMIEIMAEGEMEAAEKAKQIWAIDPNLFTACGRFEDQEADYAPIDPGS